MQKCMPKSFLMVGSHHYLLCFSTFSSAFELFSIFVGSLKVTTMTSSELFIQLRQVSQSNLYEIEMNKMFNDIFYQIQIFFTAIF